MEAMEARLLKFLLHGPATAAALVRDGKALVDQGNGRCIAVSVALLQALARRGVVRETGGKLHLTAEGMAKARRDAAGREAGFQAQHCEIELREGEGGRTVLAVNLDESPLGQIARRKDKEGKLFLSEAEVRAGERLRSDYTRGQMMPRLGANWEPRISSGTGHAAGGIAELTDAALSARLRVEKAIVEVGPELAGVLLDVCCFLKGLETVEAERRWPARSAKIVLKAALGALARHYEPPRIQSRERMLHWGAEDYRPSIGC
ncbi:MAG: DUF6456 domain-containing protein [Rhizobiaceae bacterium]|nr:DUF6456 domain-containing protein [Rhizobiaceae bacterium]